MIRWFVARRCVLALWAVAAASCGNNGAAPPEPGPAAAAAPAETPSASAAPSASGPVVVGTVPGGGSSTTVVVLEPLEPQDYPPPASPPVMDQVQREFVPGILVARTGHPIDFLNNDPELHNLNVKEAASRAQAFNVAVPQGGKYVHTLKESGVYEVSCDIHPTMFAMIIATSSPYVAYTDATGAFAIPGVPPGDYVAKAYGGGRTLEQKVTVTAGRTEMTFSGS